MATGQSHLPPARLIVIEPGQPRAGLPAQLGARPAPGTWSGAFLSL
jgi:hypothetical protein